MKLAIHVAGRDVARLEQQGDFKSVLTYHADVDAADLVSLTAPVRSESYVWDDPLPPFLQMNLPEGYLLQVLQEQLGIHITADPTGLLAVIGRNMIGRVQVATPGATLDFPPQAFELSDVLHGDNSEQTFDRLVRRFATSGVSGVVPKFLDNEDEPLGGERKTTVVTRRHIIKGSSAELPYVALNEHLCMEVVRRVMPAARTEISDDGRALIVHRFDVDEEGRPHWGMEDFCALLGMRPANKYDTTWERIVKSLRAQVPIQHQRAPLRHLAQIVLLSYALQNSDCHAKNVALLYSSRADVRLAPTYDMFTTVAYADHRDRPPGLSLAGKKTWKPGKTLERTLVTVFGLELREQKKLVEEICDAASDVAPQVREAMKQHEGFEDIGKRMLVAWKEGINSLRDRRVFGLAPWKPGPAFTVLPPGPRKVKRHVLGHSELLGRRRK